jgi:hypothetical protein
MNERPFFNVGVGVVFVGVVAAASGPFGCGEEPCGDGVCDAAERADGSCAVDCAPSCGDGVCDAGETGCPGDCGVPDTIDLRACTFDFILPTGLQISSGILTSEIAAGDINILLRVRTLSFAPTLELADGEPGAVPSTYDYPVDDGVAFQAVLDGAARRLTSVSSAPVRFDVDLDYDGDGINEQVVPVDLLYAGFDLVFDAAYVAIPFVTELGASTVSGYLAVEWACGITVQVGASTFLNVLDLIDGNGEGTNPPVLEPGACAAGDGPANLQPDADLDGDGVTDAYAATMRIAASPVTITP